MGTIHISLLHTKNIRQLMHFCPRPERPACRQHCLLQTNAMAVYSDPTLTYSQVISCDTICKMFTRDNLIISHLFSGHLLRCFACVASVNSIQSSQAFCVSASFIRYARIFAKFSIGRAWTHARRAFSVACFSARARRQRRGARQTGACIFAFASGACASL